MYLVSLGVSERHGSVHCASASQSDRSTFRGVYGAQGGPHTLHAMGPCRKGRVNLLGAAAHSILPTSLLYRFLLYPWQDRRNHMVTICAMYTLDYWISCDSPLIDFPIRVIDVEGSTTDLGLTTLPPSTRSLTNCWVS